ncbi:hypothetical protein TrRE_jg3953, partial [Triparma retinervis]
FLYSIGDNCSSSSAAVELTAGGIAGCVAWGACLPFDVLKTRVQGGAGREGLAKTFKTMVKEEGAGSLFAGAGPILSRAFLVNGITFYVYEEACRMIDRLGGENR